MSFTSLRAILERFSYPISEEQAWAICYLTVLDLKSLPGPWIYKPESICKSKFSDSLETDALPVEAVHISRSGEVRINRKVISSIFVNNGSETSSSVTTDSDSDDLLHRLNATSNATEYDLIAPIAVMLYNALDYKLGDLEERQLEPSLSNLIEIMLDVSEGTRTSDSPSFGDDLSDSPSEFENENLDRLASPPYTPLHPSFSPQHSCKLPNQIGLNEVLEKCKAHFSEEMASFSDGHLEMVIHSHYTNVCKNLVDEFYSCNITLDNLQYHEGLRDWERIIESLDTRDYELRNSKILPPRSSTLPNFKSDSSALEVMQSQIKNFKRDQMKHVPTNSRVIKPRKELDQFRQTLENIKNKTYNLRPVSERVLKERPEATRRVSTPHEMLMEQIQQAPPLKQVPPEFKRRYTIDLHKMKFQKQYNTPKRYYPPRSSLEEVIAEDDMLHDDKRQGIVHGRSVSLPYEKVNKVPSYKVPINHNLGDECSSSTSGSDPNDSPPWLVNSRVSPVYSDATSLCSLDYSTPYYGRPSSSASTGMLLEMASQRYEDMNSSRDTVIISDDSSFGESNREIYRNLQNEAFYQTSPLSYSLLYSSSRSLGVKERKRKEGRNSNRPFTALEVESNSFRNSPPINTTGVYRLQELAHQRDLHVQNYLAELSERHPTLYLDTVFGRMCFVCNTRFTWKKWSSHCKLCNRKVCANCKVTKVLPPAFLNCPPNEKPQDSKKKEGKKILVCQHCNIYLFNVFNEPIRSSRDLFNAPRF